MGSPYLTRTLGFLHVEIHVDILFAVKQFTCANERVNSSRACLELLAIRELLNM